VLNPGDSIDIWVVEKQLGSGGMGSVYRCHNRSATRILAAVKVLDSSVSKTTGAQERFIREAEILFRLEHPNIVKVRNIRTDTAPPYLEMEFVEGKSLEDMLEKGGIPLSEAMDMIAQLVDSVAYLHEQGIRHRDIKPANLLIKGDGRLKLVDFGLAMEADETRITQAGTTFGTVSYAPPEWVTPDAMDPVRWDVYSMGVVAWEILTGDVAFPVSGQGNPRQQAMQVMLQKQNHPPLDPGDGFPEALRALIRDMTAARADQRPESAASVLDRVIEMHGNYRPAVAPAGENSGSRSIRSQATPKRPDTWTDEHVAAGVASAVAPEAARLPVQESPETLSPRRKSPVEGRSSGDRSGETTAERTNTKTKKKKSAPPPARWSARWPLAIGAVVSVFLFVGIVSVSLIGAVVISTGEQPLPERDVDVVVAGLPGGTPLALELAAPKRIAPASKDGWVYHFRDLPVGKVSLKAVIGTGCAPACFDGSSCPAWCGVQTVDGTVGAGGDLQTLPINLDPPPPRPLRVQAHDVPAGTPVTLRIDEKPVTELVPGRYDVTADAGGPAWIGSIVVPWGTGEASIDVPVKPAPAPPPPIESKVEVKPDHPKVPDHPVVTPPPTPPPETGPTSGKLVTNAQFARWLATHVDWQRDAAIAAGLADAAYLAGWNAATPPAGAENAPAVSVTYSAAAAYCQGHGGLAPLDAPPLTWPDPNVGMEWRANAGKAAFRGGDGTEYTSNVHKNEGNVFTAFRCAK
jgi:serine/threonine protein kinase